MAPFLFSKSASRSAILALAGAILLLPMSGACAQELLPSLPDPLQDLVNQGAQVRYLGKDAGVDGWVFIKNGQEQYFYVLPDGRGFLSGVLLDNSGKVITLEQVSRLRGEEGDLLDTLTGERPSGAASEAAQARKYELKTPSEQLYADIESGNWIPFGQAGTPLFYVFVDPQCPYCKQFMRDMKDAYIGKGLAQARLVPVGFKDQSKAQAAYLLAAPDPAGAWWRHLDGDETALPAKTEISQQGVQRNMSIMTSWKLDSTPLIVYRSKSGSVKIIQGRPKDIDGFVADLGARS